MATKKYQCPLCKSSIPKLKFDRVTGIWKTQQEENKKLKSEHKKMRDEILREKKKLALEKKKLQVEKKKASEILKKKNAEIVSIKLVHKKEMAKKVKEETGKALKKQSTQLEKMKEANKKMKRQIELARSGRSEADLGFAKEQELCKALKKAYPEDLIKVVGKGGDVLHSVKRRGKILDTIIYECKEVATHTSAHVNQASRAKSQRNALFAVLVTTGKTTKNFNGFKVEKNVTVVRPEAVLVIANTLRDQILEMEKLKIKESQKNKVANRALKYLNSTSYKTPITTAIKICDDNIKELNKEIRVHLNNWKKRYKNYKSLSANIELLSENSDRAIKGEKLKGLPKANYSMNFTIPLLR